MDTEFWDAVRQRAHALWLQEGCPEGRSQEHWQQAQRDVLESLQTAPATAAQTAEECPAEMPPCVEEEAEAQPTDIGACAELIAIDPAPVSVSTPRKGTSLFKISLRQCRYIVSETYSPTIFCGAPTAGGSWCQEHRARVFVRPATGTSAQAGSKMLSAR